MKKKALQLIFIGNFLLVVLALNAQNPTRFAGQVEKLSNKEYNFSSDKKLLVFTGSSSIVRWKNVAGVFPAYNVINNGFGGSQFSDLIYYYEELIKSWEPEILFIYEGDNDIAKGKKPNLVFKQAKSLIKSISRDLPTTRVIVISPKPCIKNWSKKDNYLKLNKKLEKYCNKKDKLDYADVWSAMVDENGVVFQDIFISDGDHMNKKGYDIWEKVIGKFLD